MWMRPYSDPALQTGHFICYQHRTDHVLPTLTKWIVDKTVGFLYKSSLGGVQEEA